MTSFGIAYLVAGLALGLSGLPNLQGWHKRLLDWLVFAYVLFAIADARIRSDPLVILGVSIVPLSYAWRYLRRKALWSAGYMLCAATVWLVWGAAVLSHHMGEWTLDFLMIAGLGLWFALAIVVPRQSTSEDPHEAYDEAFKL